MRKTKVILLLFLLTSGVLSPSLSFAEESPLYPIYKKKTKPGGGGGIGHAPINLPIEASFDNATGVLTVAAPEDLEGYVFVYNIGGGLEATSDALNCTLTIPQTFDIHVISLQGESWTGDAKISY